jgi:hypothetical protein
LIIKYLKSVIRTPSGKRTILEGPGLEKLVFMLESPDGSSAGGRFPFLPGDLIVKSGNSIPAL